MVEPWAHATKRANGPEGASALAAGHAPAQRPSSPRGPAGALAQRSPGDASGRLESLVALGPGAATLAVEDLAAAQDQLVSQGPVRGARGPGSEPGLHLG